MHSTTRSPLRATTVRLCAAAFLGFALPEPARAADPAALLRQSLQASGGAAWAKVGHLHLRYDLKQGGQQGREDDWIDLRAGRHASEARVEPYLQLEGFDGVAPWTSTPDGLAYVRGDADSLLAAANASYRDALAWWFPERHPATLADAGPRSEHGRRFDRIAITPAGGRPFTVWIDRRSHLIARFEEQQAEGREVVRFEDYRWVHGLRLPFTLRTGDGGGEASAVQQLQAVEIDPPVAPGRYALPARAPSPELAAPVTVPIRLENDVVLVDVTIDGQGPYEADFDTGGELMLTPAVVSELRLASGGQWKESGGGEGSVTTSAGGLREIAIGAATVRRPVFSVHDFDARAPRRILVGAEFLQRYAVRLDFDAMTMTLTQPERFEAPARAAVLPFHFQSNQPEITGQVDGIAATFAVDTGDDGSLLLIAPFARRHGLAERYRATIPYGGMSITATRGLYARVHRVELDGADGRPVESVMQPVTRISTQQGGFDADAYVGANLGMGILKQYNLTFDYAHRRIFLERNHLYGLPDVFNRSGMALHRDDAGWKIAQVHPGKPAERAGLRAGDAIVGMGGHAIEELDRATIEAMLVQPVGTDLAVTVRRGSQTLSATLTLEEVLADVGGE